MKALLICLLLAAAACSREQPAAPPAAAAKPVGDAARGKALVERYGCGICHVVPGVQAAQGMLGPSMAGIAARPALSNGTVQNTPENLARFVENPAALNPQSSMPPMGVTPEESKDIAAFLLTLR